MGAVDLARHWWPGDNDDDGHTTAIVPSSFLTLLASYLVLELLLCPADLPQM